MGWLDLGCHVTTRAPDDSAEGPRSGSLESRASLALKLLAALNIFAILLAMIPGTVPMSRLQVSAFHLAAGAISGVYILVALALDRRQSWAVSAIRPLLILLFVWGGYSFLAALAGGAFRIPFTTLGAAYALLGKADRKPLPRVRGRGGAMLASSVALIGMMVTSQPIFGWGGFFDVHERDLSAALAVDCGTPGSSMPQRIGVTYQWSWSNTTLLPNNEDVVLIGWNSDDAEGRPLYYFDEAADAGNGIKLGSSTGVSAGMVDEAGGQWRGRLEWKIDLSTRGIGSGLIKLVLARAANQPPPSPQPLTVGASYIHVGVWRHDAPTVTCSW